ncbi:MAG: hypothetical protein HFH82_07890 [Lachnospiraceae bacterium]|nr:hypothetical protein [Lachnospiraceae bacterium]
MQGSGDHICEMLSGAESEGAQEEEYQCAHGGQDRNCIQCSSIKGMEHFFRQGKEHNFYKYGGQAGSGQDEAAVAVSKMLQKP